MTDVFSRHRQAGIALDTNLFLLFIVGSIDCGLLEKSGKTAQFDRSDFELLVRFCSGFRRHVTTPPVITEACNLLDSLNRKTSGGIFGRIRLYLENTRESRSQSSHLSGLPIFSTLGLADASLYALATKNVLVMTDDLDLYGNLCSRGLGVLNFNHLRQMNWST